MAQIGSYGGGGSFGGISGGYGKASYSYSPARAGLTNVRSLKQQATNAKSAGAAPTGGFGIGFDYIERAGGNGIGGYSYGYNPTFASNNYGGTVGPTQLSGNMSLGQAYQVANQQIQNSREIGRRAGAQYEMDKRQRQAPKPIPQTQQPLNVWAPVAGLNQAPSFSDEYNQYINNIVNNYLSSIG